jgi:hypothetical protein
MQEFRRIFFGRLAIAAYVIASGLLYLADFSAWTVAVAIVVVVLAWALSLFMDFPTFVDYFRAHNNEEDMK